MEFSYDSQSQKGETVPSTLGLINEQNERKRILKKLASSIKERPLLCVALMLFWTWLNLAYQGPLFFPPVILKSGFHFSTWVGPIFASALAYFTLGVWFKRTNRVIKQRWYIGCVCALMALGALLCFLWINGSGASLDTVPTITLYVLGSLAIGIGTALLMIEWGRIFGYLGSQQVLFHGIIAMLGSALLVSVLSLMLAVVGQLLFVLIPVPLAACLNKTLRSLPRKILYNHGLDAELKVPYKFLITSFLHGLSLGVLMGWLLLLGNQSSMSLLTALCFVVAAILLLLTAAFFKMDFNHLLYQVGFGITATGAFLIACFGNIPVFGVSFQLVGFCYVHLTMWGLCSYLIKNFKLPSTWVIAWPTCCLMLGQLLGGVVGSVLGQQHDAPHWIQLLAICMLFMLLMAALLMFSSRNYTTGWGIASPGNLIHADSALDVAAENLKIKYNLTPRETEILTLMSRGRNRKVISAELVISEETTKSHINALYRKLGIHSQQELLDLTEALVEEDRSKNQSIPFE